jgi:predicted branched-subunit amino acid permease
MGTRGATTQPGTVGATALPTTADTEENFRREAVKGASTMLPLLIGYLPLALAIGVAAGDSTSPLAASAGALLIFSGSAHLAVIELVRNGSGVAVAVGTGLLINARLTVYSVSLVPLWREAPLRHRLLAAAVVIDPMWLIARQRQAQPGTASERRAFFGGAAATLVAGWSAMIGAGTLLGTPRSAMSFLGICMPLCLSAIVVPHLRTAAGARCVCAAGVVAASTSSWPSGTGLLVAMAAGAAAGSSWPRQVRRVRRVRPVRPVRR